MTSLGIRVTRGAFGLADHIAPRLTGVIAMRLFSRTSNPRRLSAREQAAVGAAGGFMAGARTHRLSTGWRRCVAAHEFRPQTQYPNARIVLVLHGWKSRTEHMRGIVEALLGQGFRVIALDLPGHGASSGRRLNMANAVAAVGLAAQWFGPFAAVVGHSFGGAVAVNAAAGSVDGVAPVETGRLVLISAPSSMPAIFDDFARFLNLGPQSQTALAGEVARLTGNPLSSFVGAEQVAALRMPVLAVHAPDDREVPFSEARAFEAAGSHVTLLRAPGLGHRRILADEGVAAAIAHFAAGSGGAACGIERAAA